MTLEIVEKYTMEPVGTLSPIEEAALRAVRRGDADAAMRTIYRLTAGRLREEGSWLGCDCAAGAAIAFRLQSNGSIAMVNLPEAPVPHAPGCPFGLRDAGDDADAAALVADLFLADERETPREGPGEGGVERPWSGGRPSSLSQVLKTLMSAAGLNRFDGIAAPAAPEDWLESCRRAAGEFRVAGRVPVSDILYTDPAEWAADETPDRLDELARGWWGRGQPFALLCWLARDVAPHGINRTHPDAGQVAVRYRIRRPIIGRAHVRGPFLFLGIVARAGGTGDWACRAAAVQPIVSPDIPMPVDSHYERRALARLRGAVAELARDAELRAALGGPARFELEKPLFPFVVRGGACLPDAILKVIRPGGRDRVPAGPDGPLPQGAFADRDRARYVIEVMGFADAAYERRKEITHARMRRLGRLIRMEAGQFDSTWNDLNTQTRGIARRIGKDLIARWNPA